MKFTNKDAFFRDMERRVRAGLVTDVLPVFKGIVMEAAKALVEGDYRYAGTPQWSGNAAANWWPSFAAPASGFTQFFDEPKWGREDGSKAAAEPSPYNSTQNPRGEANTLSIARVDAFLRAMTALPDEPVWITNTAPYLQDYQPYGEGAVFRLENLYPLSAMRATTTLNQRIAQADAATIKQWKAGYAT